MRRNPLAILRDTSGVTAIEFALVLPVMLLLAAGTIDFGRLLLVTQKLQNGTFILADLTARDKTLTQCQMDNIFLALDNIIRPFEFLQSGTAIVTSVGVNGAGDPVVNWQQIGAGELDATSTVGAIGEEATLPDELSIVAGETIIVAEVFYAFVPPLGLTVDEGILHRLAYVRPRLGTLTSLAPCV
jgi:Flp pilus assembly protein TadG